MRTVQSDFGGGAVMIPQSIEDPPSASLNRTVCQGVKLHVLGLELIKERLGSKWPRLSALVHKLMRKAIVRTQGPFDHFIVLDELSYVVTFAELSSAQTELICEAIAREVCELLFGEQVQEISIRTVTAPVPQAMLSASDEIGVLEHTIEQRGTEVVYRYVRPVHENTVPRPIRREASTPLAILKNAAEIFAAAGLSMNLFPIWDLRRGIRNSLLLRIERPELGQSAGAAAADPALQLQEEIILLRATEAYAARLAEDDQVCAINTAVSYATLSCLQTRIGYLTALQQVSFSPRTPVVLRVVDVPRGAPEGRLAELVAMLHSTQTRVALKFLPPLLKLGIRLGADGIGVRVPVCLHAESFLPVATALSDLAFHQKAFAFIDGLDTVATLEIARRSNVRFGTGRALGGGLLDVTGTVPRFPLSLAVKDHARA